MVDDEAIAAPMFGRKCNLRSEAVKNEPLGVSPMPSTLGAQVGPRASRPQRIAENSRAGRPRTAHDLAPLASK